MHPSSVILQLCLILLAVAVGRVVCESALHIRHKLIEEKQRMTDTDDNSRIASRQSQSETPKLESLFTFQSYEIVVDPVARVPRMEMSLEEQVVRVPIIATFNLRNPFNNTDLRIESLVLNGYIRSPASVTGSEEPAELIPFACGAVSGDLAADIPAYPKIDALTSRNVTLPLQVTLPFHKDSRQLRVLQETCVADRTNDPDGAGSVPTPSITTVWKGQVKITAMQRLIFGLYLPIVQDVDIKDVSFDMPCPTVFAQWQGDKDGCGLKQ